MDSIFVVVLLSINTVLLVVIITLLLRLQRIEQIVENSCIPIMSPYINDCSAFLKRHGD